MKYMSKNPKKTKSLSPDKDKVLQVEGRVWGCSFPFLNFKDAQAGMDSEIKQELDKIVASPKTRVFHEEFYHVYSIHVDDLKALGCTRLLLLFHKMLKKYFPCSPLPPFF
jgi:hypothetical protein